MSLLRRAANEAVTIDRIFDLSMPEPNSGCWIWMGAITRATGYGAIGFNGKVQRVSRVVMELMTGAPVAPSLYVCHRCDNPYCVNPDHLFLGTPSDNIQDCLAKRRHVAPSRATHGRAKLSPDAAQAVVASAEGNRALASRYSVNITTIRRIRRQAIASAQHEGHGETETGT